MSGPASAHDPRAAELFRALALLAEPPAEGHAAVAAALDLPPPPTPSEHADLLVFQLPPYASIYLGPEGMMGGEAVDRVAGFWRAVGRTPPSEPDHLSALLSLHAALLDEAGDAGPEVRPLVERGARALVVEHLDPWLFVWLDRVEALGGPFHRAWGALLRQVLAMGATRKVPLLSAHLRSAPPLPDPRHDGGEAFLAGLLAPVRSGMILTRADLAEVAAELDLGLRAGERRYVLEHLLAQEPAPVLDALGKRAGNAADLHGRSDRCPEPVRDFWGRQGRAAAALLGELAAEARTAEPVEAGS